MPNPGPATRATGRRLRARLHDGAFVLATVALLLAKVRYGFEVNDQAQYFLLPYREIYADFLPGDWFTWQTTHYHVTFSWLIRGIHALFGEQGFALGVFLAYCAVLAGLGASLLALSRAAGLGRFPAWFALLVTAFVRSRALGGAVVTHGVLLPADAALPPFLLACAAFVARRTTSTGLWLGSAGFLHANYAALGPVLVGGLELARGPRDAALLRRGLTMAAGYLVLAWPTLWVIASSFLWPDTAPGQTALFFEVRSPHHYEVDHFASTDLWWLASLGLLAAPVLARREPGPAALRLLAVGIVAVLLVGLLGAWLELTAIVRVFVWRLAVPLNVLLLLAIGAALRDAARARRWPMLGVQLAGALWLASFTAAGTPWPERAVATLQAWARVHAPSLHTPPGGSRGRLHAFVRKHTPPDARVLVPPGFIDFRLHARRAIFVDWKCTPMRGDELGEWKRRMLLAMGTDHFPGVGYALRAASTRAYLRQPMARLAPLARAEGLTHVIARHAPASARAAGLEPLGRVGGYTVYRVRETPSANDARGFRPSSRWETAGLGRPRPGA